MVLVKLPCPNAQETTKWPYGLHSSCLLSNHLEAWRHPV